MNLHRNIWGRAELHLSVKSFELCVLQGQTCSVQRTVRPTAGRSPSSGMIHSLFKSQNKHVWFKPTGSVFILIFIGNDIKIRLWLKYLWLFSPPTCIFEARAGAAYMMACCWAPFTVRFPIIPFHAKYGQTAAGLSSLGVNRFGYGQFIQPDLRCVCFFPCRGLKCAQILLKLDSYLCNGWKNTLAGVKSRRLRRRAAWCRDRPAGICSVCY